MKKYLKWVVKSGRKKSKCLLQRFQDVPYRTSFKRTTFKRNVRPWMSFAQKMVPEFRIYRNVNTSKLRRCHFIPNFSLEMRRNVLKSSEVLSGFLASNVRICELCFSFTCILMHYLFKNKNFKSVFFYWKNFLNFWNFLLLWKNNWLSFFVIFLTQTWLFPNHYNLFHRPKMLYQRTKKCMAASNYEGRNSSAEAWDKSIVTQDIINKAITHVVITKLNLFSPKV